MESRQTERQHEHPPSAATGLSGERSRSPRLCLPARAPAPSTAPTHPPGPAGECLRALEPVPGLFSQVQGQGLRPMLSPHHQLKELTVSKQGTSPQTADTGKSWQAAPCAWLPRRRRHCSHFDVFITCHVNTSFLNHRIIKVGKDL